MKIYVCIVIWGLIAISLPFDHAKATPPTSDSNQLLLRRAEEAHSRFDYPAAIALYEQASASVESRLKLANIRFWYAVEQDNENQERILTLNLVALDAIVADLSRGDPAGLDRKHLAEAHAQTGRTLGQLALHRGGKGKIKLGKRIQEEADRALVLDPENALAHAVLGKWNFELASLSWLERTFGSALFGSIPEGNYKIAEQELRKAVVLDPGMPYNHLMYAYALLKLDARESAVLQLEALLKLAPREKADIQFAGEARELLKKIR